ncbi:MAG: tetraacyldisaccharide 4'-kinase [Pseudomonadota bacterium]|nr:tetraacyldisaccharide 4'-kinase [Pseudomonadota bacterium]
MRNPAFWYAPIGATAIGLMPLTLVYGAAEALRRRLTKPEKPEIPVICVGNLTAGGAGKTPAVRALADMLQGAGHQPIVLSRGFGGRNAGPLRVDPTRHVAVDTGDEPLMLADDLTTYVARDRRAALRAAVSDSARIAIKDDGFQNPTLTHNYNLIVVDAATGFGNALLLPAGPLRQPLAASAPRIDAVLLVGETSEQIRADIAAQLGMETKRIFNGALVPVAPDPKRVLAYCGIGRPEKFFDTLRACNFELAGEISFADHHMFSDSDAARLLHEAETLNATLITTEKDLVRLRGAKVGSQLAALAAASECLRVKLTLANADGLRADILSKLDQSPH